MIPKIWCWLFGHVKTWKYDMYYKEFDQWGYPRIVSWKEANYENCPRCGAKL